MNFKINPCLKRFKLDANNVCNLCQKRILTEQELTQSNLNCPDNEICVITNINKINDDYLNHPVRIVRMAILIVFGSSLFTLNGIAQDTIKSIHNNIDKTDPPQSSMTIFKGRLLSEEDGLELIFASVIVEGTHMGVSSDMDGYFKLQVDKHSVPLPLKLKIRYIGYEEIVLDFGDDFKPGEIIELGDIYMKSDYDAISIGIIIQEPIMDKDPDAHRSTTFKREEIKRSPYRD